MTRFPQAASSEATEIPYHSDAGSTTYLSTTIYLGIKPRDRYFYHVIPTHSSRNIVTHGPVI
jgi:hypothetical protein